MSKKLTIVFIATLTLLVEYLLLLWLLKDVPVFADSFYPKGEINQCEFIPATGVTLEYLPSQGEKGVTYDTNWVSGLSESWISSHTIHDVANVYVGQVRRYPNIAGNVTAPPGAKIAVGFWWLNFSGHTIHVSDASLFLSQKNSPAAYDVSRVLSTPINTGMESYWQNNVIQSREGKVLNTGDIGSFVNTSINNAPAGKKITSLSVLQPLQIKEKSTECSISETGDIIMQKRVITNNVSQYTLNNIQPSHGQSSFQLKSKEESTLIFEENLGKQYVSQLAGSEVSIFDPNSHRECAVNGSTRGDSTDPATRILLVKRDDLNHADWWAVQPDLAAVPQTPYFCITQIPYTVTVEDFSCKMEQKLLPDLTFDKQSIQPSEEQTFVITITNQGIGVTGGTMQLLVPIADFELFHGFPGASSISTNSENAIIEYALPQIDSKATITIADTFVSGIPLSPDSRRDFEFTVQTGTGSDSGSFRIEENIIKEVFTENNGQDNSSLNANIQLLLTDKLYPFTIEMKPSVSGQVQEICQSIIPFGEILVIISPTNNGNLFFSNSAKNLIESAYTIPLTEFLSGKLILENSTTTNLEIPLQLTFSSSEGIALSLSVNACSQDGCKQSGVIFQENYPASCTSTEQSIIDSLTDFIFTPISEILTESTSTTTVQNVIENLQEGILWSEPALATVKGIQAQKLANTGMDLVKLFGYSSLVSLSSSAVLFFILIRVSKSRGKSRPKN